MLLDLLRYVELLTSVSAILELLSISSRSLVSYNFLRSVDSQWRDIRNNCQHRFAAFRVYFAARFANIRLLGLSKLITRFCDSAEGSPKLARNGVANCLVVNSILRNFSYMQYHA